MIEFDSFCYCGKVVELSDALDETQQDLKAQYDKDGLYCPECQMAQLTFTRKTSAHRAFLSTRRSSYVSTNDHRQDCSHLLAHASKRQVNKYYRSLTPAQVQDKLDAAINSFLRRDVAKSLVAQPIPFAQNPAVMQVAERGKKTYKRLPVRSFYSIYDVTEEEFDIPVLLYGIVRLKTEKVVSNDKTWYYNRLNVYSQKADERIRWFYRAQNEDAVKWGKLYYLAMIAIYHINEASGKLRIDLFNQQSVRILPLL